MSLPIFYPLFLAVVEAQEWRTFDTLGSSSQVCQMLVLPNSPFPIYGFNPHLGISS